MHYFLSTILFFFLTQISSSPDVNKSLDLSSSERLGCNPLKNFSVITIHPQYTIESELLQEEVLEVIIDELKKIGNVITLKVPDPEGYGKGEALMSMTFKNITVLNNSKFPASEISLSLSSSTQIEKTNVKCATYIWTAQRFVEGNIEKNNSQNIKEGVKTLVNQFSNQYTAANNNKRPTFYLYKN